VEGEIVFDGGRRLHRLDLEGGTDVSQGARAKGQRLRVMCLPTLVFGAKVEGAGMLEIGWQHNRFVTGFAGQLNTQIPRVKGDKGKFKVFGKKMLLCEAVQAVDGVAEGAGVADLVPGQGGQAC